MTRSRPAGQGASRHQGSGFPRRIGGSLAGKSGDHHQHQKRRTAPHNICRDNYGPHFGCCARITGIPKKSWKKRSSTAHPLNRPSAASEPPDGLITRPLSPSCRTHTPWGHCDRLGGVVGGTVHSLPAAVPQAKDAKAPRWEMALGGVSAGAL